MAKNVIKIRVRDHVDVEGNAPPELLQALDEAELSMEIVQSRGAGGVRLGFTAPRGNAAWDRLQQLCAAEASQR